MTVFSANYQQRPQPPEGAHIQRTWLKYYAPDELPEDPDAFVQSWDTALKVGEDNGFSVCTTWMIREQHFYLLDVFRQRVHYNTLKATATNLADTFRPTAILIEEQASGFPLLQELKDAGLPAEPAPTVIGGKEERLLARINKFAGSFVHLPKEASWLEDYVEELVNFPHTKFSDQVDSTVHALAWDSGDPNRSFANYMGYLKLMAEQEGFSLDGKPILAKNRNTKTGGTLITMDGKSINYSKDEIIEVTREDAAACCMNPLNGFVRA
jgi:predicted phage terminase large subunit-like protein